MGNLHLVLTVLLVVFSLQTKADMYFGRAGKIYSLETKDGPATTKAQGPSNLAQSHFLKIEATPDLKNGTTTYKAKEEPTRLGPFVLNKTPVPPPSKAGEGCSENPMKWLAKAKELGRLKTPDTALYVQVPDELKEFKKSQEPDPSCKEGEHRELSLVGGPGKGRQAFLICADDLNYSLRVFASENKKWTLLTDLTVTENCP